MSFFIDFNVHLGSPLGPPLETFQAHLLMIQGWKCSLNPVAVYAITIGKTACVLTVSLFPRSAILVSQGRLGGSFLTVLVTLPGDTFSDF